MEVLVSPSEPTFMRALGATSGVPERFGADVCLHSEDLGGWVGVQRKEFGDLLSSVRDGRLARGIAAMSGLAVAVLVVEGEPTWGPDGYARPAKGERKPPTSWRRDQYRAMLWSIRARGVWIETSDGPDDTVAVVRGLVRWVAKGRHQLLDLRPTPRVARHLALHLLQSFTGIGPTLAARIVDHFDGLPLAWTVTEEDLAAVTGMGRVRARRLVEALADAGVREAVDA